MKKQKSKKPTWIDVKKSIKDIENSKLIELVKDLYDLQMKIRISFTLVS
jgi:hypothetical protein